MKNLCVCFALFVLAVVLGSGAAWAQTNAPGRGGRGSVTSPPHDPHDLTGIWNLRGFGGGGGFRGEDPKLTALGEELFNRAKSSNSGEFTLEETNDPVLTRCLPPGVPRIYLQPFPWQIVQTPNEMLFLYEYDHTVRRIFTDGREHGEDLTPTYMGHSIGHWDGDTFVVDTIGFFNQRSWLDRIGHAQSDQLHVIERFRRQNLNELELQVTMEDPKTLAAPWTVNLQFELRPDWTIQEQNCADNAEFLEYEQ